MTGDLCTRTMLHFSGWNDIPHNFSIPIVSGGHLGESGHLFSGRISLYTTQSSAKKSQNGFNDGREVVDKDKKEYWSQHTFLGNTALDVYSL